MVLKIHWGQELKFLNLILGFTLILFLGVGYHAISTLWTNHIVTDSFLQKLFTTAPISLSHIVAFRFPWRCQRGFVWVINKTFLGLSWILYLGSLGVFGVRKENRNSTLLLFALQLSAKENQRYQRKVCNKIGINQESYISFVLVKLSYPS